MKQADLYYDILEFLNEKMEEGYDSEAIENTLVQIMQDRENEMEIEL